VKIKKLEADFHISYTTLSALSIAIVGKKLSLRANLLTLHGRSHSRMGRTERHLHGGTSDYQMPSMGWFWI
jgi:hypothetical protein